MAIGNGFPISTGATEGEDKNDSASDGQYYKCKNHRRVSSAARSSSLMSRKAPPVLILIAASYLMLKTRSGD
jgi:hypothetical protein